jgi:polyisoprenoid-binding protein YceI
MNDMPTGIRGRTGTPTGTWRVDKARTRVGFAVKQLGVSTVRGEFREFDGALELTEDLGDARAYGRVDAASVDTNLARRDQHLRSTDFLSAERHPELTFRSKAFEPVDENTLRVIGDLSINGVTKAVALTAALGAIAIGAEGEERISIGVTGEISRTAFAMTFLAALGSVAVADTVRIVIDVEAVKEA